MNPDDKKEMIRLVELDFDHTTKFIEGSVSTTTSLRGWAITVWAALIGVAFSQRLWVLAALAAIAIAAFAIVDAYYLFFYWQALFRARLLEDVTAKHYDALARGTDNPRTIAGADLALTTNRYGIYRSLRDLRFSHLLTVKPRTFLIVYAILIAVAIISAVLLLALQLSTTASSSTPTPGLSPTPHATINP